MPKKHLPITCSSTNNTALIIVVKPEKENLIFLKNIQTDQI